MGFISNALARLGYYKAANIENPPRFLSEYADFNRWFEPDPNQTRTQTQIYSRVSWIASAVNLVASVAATTPIMVKSKSDSGNEDIDNHPFEQLLFKPNPAQSRHEFLYASMAWYLVTGNCYWWLNRQSENEKPDELWIIPTQMLRPVPSKQMFVHGYMYDAGNGTDIPIDAHEICHFKSFNPDNMFVGLSILESLYNTAAHDSKATEWNKNFFAKGNAKPTGVMAFSSPIDAASWAAIKNEVKAEYGGASRQLLMLQNTGQGAVNFIPTMLSQHDMEFIESRKFNRDEIFNAIAPGAAGMVDVNATEANSKTGRDIFFSIGVYPRLDFIAQKITRDILPAYGENLICQFDDVRQRDIALELAQIESYGKYHTISETRQEWYNEQPIGDERDDMLVAEISQRQPETEPEPPQAEIEPAEIDIEPLKAMLGEISAELKAIKSAPSNVTPTTVTISQSPADQPSYHVVTDEPHEPKKLPVKSDAENDLGLWEKKASNRASRGRNITVPFESEHLGTPVKAFVAMGLDRGDMDVFEAAKLLLQLDPDDDEAEQKARMELEKQAADRIAKALAAQKKTTVAAAKDGRTEPPPREGSATDALRRMLIESVDLGVAVSIKQFDNVGFAFDWTLANEEAREWANQYAGELITNINATTQRQVQQSVSQWISNGEPLTELVKELEATFGETRAELIASTEVTNAYSRATQISYRQSGVVEEMEIRTSNDELVCPVCGPKNGERVPVDAHADDIPSFHPRCRCWVAAVIKVETE